MHSPNVMRTPRAADIAITGECNLRCSYCSHFDSAGDAGRDLPTESWLRFFEQLGRCAVMRVTLQGGEPFCRPDLPELLQGIVANRMRFRILSNGTLIDDRMAAVVASSGRCDGVQVSIDSFVPGHHDAVRGRGSFDRAIEGIRALKRHGVPIDVRVTIHRLNVGDLEGVARLLLDELGLQGFSTNSASHLGLCRRNREQVQLTVQERSLAMQALLLLSARYPGRISASAGALAEARRWSEMVRARQDGVSLPGGGFLTGCGGPLGTIAVRADGVYTPCMLLGHVELGRVDRDDLAELWQNHPALGELRRRCTIPLSDFELCRGCEFIETCTGNCPALAYTAYKKVNHPSPDACLRRFLQAGGRLPER
jgi:SynChlorMet cassette radical SAM/SPASM protein ScmE